jgi:hypothetical protein
MKSVRLEGVRVTRIESWNAMLFAPRRLKRCLNPILQVAPRTLSDGATA